MASEAEREIRTAVADALRRFDPAARVVHELNVDHGQCRVDVAAIGERYLTFVEIKSKRDKLDRLKRQVEMFDRACHSVIVVLDQKFFHDRYKDRVKEACGPYFIGPATVWRWPRPEGDGYMVDGAWRHRFYPRRQGVEPHAMRLLELLWRDELHAECAAHRISAGPRTDRWTMIRDMAWLMTGKEVVEAVCRRLRARPFPEADPPLT